MGQSDWPQAPPRDYVLGNKVLCTIRRQNEEEDVEEGRQLDKTEVPGLSACMGWVRIKWKQSRAWKEELASQISR